MILDQNNKPVYNPVVIGTYNFATYRMIVEPDALAHLLTDVKLWKKYGTGPNDSTTRKEREKIGDSNLGLRIQNSYNEIMNELKARGKDKASLNELTEILEKIETEKMVKKALKRVKEIEDFAEPYIDEKTKEKIIRKIYPLQKEFLRILGRNAEVYDSLEDGRFYIDIYIKDLKTNEIFIIKRDNIHIYYESAGPKVFLPSI
ncbi:hypothetical protein [Fusobacterium periodonticum]|uniref:Uncharacterized protein n=1 Tax=Fusobacterium periodonticum D10 TaxID=620833 RepID=K1GFV6_9FUSO|nr:hypothetical protein FPOG_02139 [Fusobacterium periodonticum D10]